MKEIEPDFANRKIQKRLMLVFDESVGILKLKDFETKVAIACLDQGQWLNLIYQGLAPKLNNPN